MTIQHQTSQQLQDADRDARFAASDARALAAMARGEIVEHKPIVRNAVLNRDMVGINRGAAALRRFSRSPMGMRAARAA